MNASDHLDHAAVALTSAAHDFRSVAGRLGAHAAAPESLASLEDALQALSGAWYQLAADASPGIASRRASSRPRSRPRQKVDSLSREQEVRLMGALHDVAAAFARCARVCREGRSTVAPLIDRRLVAGRETPRHDNEALLVPARGAEPPANPPRAA